MSSQLAALHGRGQPRPEKQGKTAGRAAWGICSGPVAGIIGILWLWGRWPDIHRELTRPSHPISPVLVRFSRGEEPVREFALAFDALVASIPLVAQATSRLDLVINFAMLAAVVAVAVVVILWVRRRWLGLDGVGGFDGTDGADWQDALVRYRNIRDEGGLSEEEFRRIRTLVGPRIRTDTPELRGRQRPPSDPIGPAAERE